LTLGGAASVAALALELIGSHTAHGPVSLGRLAALLTGVLFGTGVERRPETLPTEIEKKVPAVTGFSLRLRVER
jgi:hypothetical protein